MKNKIPAVFGSVVSLASLLLTVSDKQTDCDIFAFPSKGDALQD